MQKPSSTKKTIKELLTSQKLGVLSTSDKTNVHASLVAFSASKDLKRVYFYTLRATRKFQLLQNNPHICLLVDNRSNQESDFHAASAIGVYGKVVEIDKNENKKEAKSFLKKNSTLKDFTESDSSAFLEIQVDRYSLVQEFQNVIDMVIEP